jgi:hypothetical protein
MLNFRGCIYYLIFTHFYIHTYIILFYYTLYEVFLAGIRNMPACKHNCEGKRKRENKLSGGLLK